MINGGGRERLRQVDVSVYSLACKRVLTCTTVVMETIPPFYYMRACPILDLYLGVTRKRALSEFLSASFSEK